MLVRDLVDRSGISTFIIGMRIDDDEWKLFRPSDAVEYYD